LKKPKGIILKNKETVRADREMITISSSFSLRKLTRVYSLSSRTINFKVRILISNNMCSSIKMIEISSVLLKTNIKKISVSSHKLDKQVKKELILKEMIII
jgi:hypothetical protein